MSAFILNMLNDQNEHTVNKKAIHRKIEAVVGFNPFCKLNDIIFIIEMFWKVSSAHGKLIKDHQHSEDSNISFSKVLINPWVYYEFTCIIYLRA